MESGYDYQGLIELLAEPAGVLELWVASFARSPMRVPRSFDRPSLLASLEPITDAIGNVVAPDRAGKRPVDLHFIPGARALREVEKAISFAAAHLAVDGFTGFDAGALLFGLRDILCAPLQGLARDEMQLYMEWLVVLAADSLATGREQAAIERWHHQLDEGTPLVMITPELPATFFVCEPDRQVVASVFGRLLLTVVRTGGKAVIVDVRGMSGRSQSSFFDGLESFIGHARIATRIKILACGVHVDDIRSWKTIGDRHGADLQFENYFDTCVQIALKAGGWRIVAPA